MKLRISTFKNNEKLRWSFNGLQLFSDICHQALYIYLTIIVAVDLPFQFSISRVGRLADFIP
jgi:hypothetical protein